MTFLYMENMVPRKSWSMKKMFGFRRSSSNGTANEFVTSTVPCGCDVEGMVGWVGWSGDILGVVEVMGVKRGSACSGGPCW